VPQTVTNWISLAPITASGNLERFSRYEKKQKLAVEKVNLCILIPRYQNFYVA